MILATPVRMSQHSRHLACVRVSAEFLFEILKTSKPRVISVKGLPVDAVSVRIAQDSVNNTVVIFYEHPSFRLTSPGDIVDVIYPEFTEYFGKRAVEELIR